MQLRVMTEPQDAESFRSSAHLASIIAEAEAIVNDSLRDRNA
jgi:hypothetical protein